jgi:hypothetical protein
MNDGLADLLACVAAFRPLMKREHISCAMARDASIGRRHYWIDQ